MLHIERTEDAITIYKHEFVVSAKVVEGLLLVKARKGDQSDECTKFETYDFSFDVSDQNVDVQEDDKKVILTFTDKQ